MKNMLEIIKEKKPLYNIKSVYVTGSSLFIKRNHDIDYVVIVDNDIVSDYVSFEYEGIRREFFIHGKKTLETIEFRDDERYKKMIFFLFVFTSKPVWGESIEIDFDIHKESFFTEAKRYLEKTIYNKMLVFEEGDKFRKLWYVFLMLKYFEGIKYDDSFIIDLLDRCYHTKNVFEEEMYVKEKLNIS